MKDNKEKDFQSIDDIKSWALELSYATLNPSPNKKRLLSIIKSKHNNF
ncbi:MAG: hypothetical protein LBS76_00110 [Mycoplasmataceae bacterium]|nr:hypothetical protein [Mycoplasmataceae bacterium]